MLLCEFFSEGINMAIAHFGPEAFVLNKDLGRIMATPAEAFPSTDSEGRPVVELTQEQRYLFDKNGWLLVPDVLSEGEIEEAREFIIRLHKDPDSIAEHERSPIGGPAQRLIDHPVVVGFMNEFVYHPFTDGSKTPPLSNENCYGFRFEYSFYQYREAGDGRFAPHNGSGMLRLPSDHHTYHCFPGHAHSALTRAVWELNPVNKGDGGTLFISGSHKSAFTAPDSINDPASPLWTRYACPAGSVLFFTEAVTHSSDYWSADQARVAIFNSYNAIGNKWHNWNPNPQLLSEMPAKRQTLFRPVYVSGNVVE